MPLIIISCTVVPIDLSIDDDDIMVDQQPTVGAFEELCVRLVMAGNLPLMIKLYNHTFTMIQSNIKGRTYP